MSMSCYAWELACLSAFVEADNAKVAYQIAVARSVIAGRFLESVPVDEEEWLKIEAAVKALESLEKEKILVS